MVGKFRGKLNLAIKKAGLMDLTNEFELGMFHHQKRFD
jgi:hypothetical protein